MRTHSPLLLLAALGVLATLPPAAAQTDTSEWKCQTCPYPKGSSGSVEIGVGGVSDASAKFGDKTGLERDGAHLVLGGGLSLRSGSTYVDLAGSDLGLDSRSLAAQIGSEGVYSLRLGYSELPRHFADGAQTPFIGSGGSVLTLPAGFAAASTAAMPLGSTLRPVDLGYTWKRFDLGGSVVAGSALSFRIGLRRDVRDGSRATTGSFFSTAAQMAAPVDHETDQLEVGLSYNGGPLQASLAYVISQFRNGAGSLTWDNPFTALVTGSTRGQLALAPDNEFHQIVGSAGYTITPWLRASADFAYGRSTQNEPFLASTLNTGLAATVPVLAVKSLGGRANTFNGSVRLSATPMPGLRLNAVYARDTRENETVPQSVPQVATDMYDLRTSRSSTPFSLWQDRLKLSADYRAGATLRLSAGADLDNRERTYTEAVTTRETTYWAKAGVQPLDMLSLAFKLAHGERRSSPYGIATWFGSAESPLLRKYNLAERKRDTAGARADLALSDKLSLGLSADYNDDRYGRSLVGLVDSRGTNLSADLAYALSEQTKLTLFAQGERIRSRQDGSQSGVLADWTARNKDRFEVLGVGVKHAAIPDKLDLGADISLSKARSDVAVDTGVGDPPFPTAKTTLDSVKLWASYKISDKISLGGSYWYEDYKSNDWRFDGVLPATVPILLTFGEPSPRYRVHLLRVALRYSF